MKKVRLHYLDNLKVAATILVIFHHTAITYGASGSWYFVQQTNDMVASVLLTLFATANQSFFMGLFFFISGYFTPSSYDRKGASGFLKDRLIRLGIPLLIYLFLIGPALLYFLQQDKQVSFINFYWYRMSNLDINWGPLWFVAALIYFSFCYALWRIICKRIKINIVLPKPSNKNIAVFIVMIGITAYIIRLFIPVGQDVLGQQLGYYASYIFLFIAGILTYRNNWLDYLTGKRIRLWFIIALLLIGALPVIFVLGGGTDNQFLGGLSLQALTYALWEPFVGIGIIMSLLVFFRQYFDKTNTFTKSLANGAYTAYVIHAPVLVFLSYFFLGLQLPALLKFIFIGSISTIVIFLLAVGITKLTYAIIHTKTKNQ